MPLRTKMHPAKTKSITLFALIAILSAAICLPAAVMRRMPVQELAQKSDLVIHGAVLGQCCHRDTDGSIYTSVEVRVDDVWKGVLHTNMVTVVQGGGTVDGVRLEVSGQAQYTKGEEVVLFLVFNPLGEPVSLGLSQGKFHVWNNGASGAKFANNPTPGEDGSDGESAAGPQPAPLPLRELRKQVQGVRP